MKNKTDILYLFLIISFAIFSFVLFKENIYSPYSDIGREFYITEQIKEGAILYKDILNVYSPLGYWTNALITKLLGNNLNIFYGIGLVLSILTLIPIYLTSKIYTNKHIGFILTILTCTCCTFYPSISNWITPYSYSILYACCSFMWSILFFTKYLEEKDRKYSFLCSFFIGLSICFKYEYILACVPIIIYTLINRTNKRTLLGIIIPPTICILILLIQGCNIQNLLDAINKVIKLSNNDYVKFFYNFAGITPSINSIKTAVVSIFNPQFKTVFYSITYINILFMFYAIKTKEIKLIILVIISILASVKTLGGISLEIYGTFFLPILLIALMSAIYYKANKAKSTVIFLLCTLLSFFFFFHTLEETKKLVRINTSKGYCKIPHVYLDTTIQVLNYISDNNDNKFLILPEGAILNYFRDKQSDNFLYYLIPPNYDILGYDFIKSRIEEKEIGTILVSNIQYPWYREGSFINTWGEKIIKEIKNNYKYERTIGKDFKFYIYKRDII